MSERAVAILAGPTRKLPDRRAHEVFEEQARVQPQTIAAVHGSRQLTYAELNARANHVARALSARGLTREGVVGVVAERNLDWLTAVLAIFKAGGVYLPVEPHFPPERVAKMLSRAGARLVLTDGSGAASGGAARCAPTLLIDTAHEEGHSDADLGIAVTPDQLAYIYFTSGSTGEPKGAMCEHAGLLNHLLAKIDDLKIGEGTEKCRSTAAPSGPPRSLRQSSSRRSWRRGGSRVPRARTSRPWAPQWSRR